MMMIDSSKCNRTVETDALRLHWECSRCGLICGASLWETVSTRCSLLEVIAFNNKLVHSLYEFVLFPLKCFILRLFPMRLSLEKDNPSYVYPYLLEFLPIVYHNYVPNKYENCLSS